MIRVKVGKHETVERMEQLESCLVGLWGGGTSLIPDLKTIVREVEKAPVTSMMNTLKSFAEAVTGTGSGITEEVIRVKVGKHETVERMEQLESCLVGLWGGGTSPIPDLKTLKYRAWHNWKVTGKMKVEVLGRGLWFWESK